MGTGRWWVRAAGVVVVACASAAGTPGVHADPSASTALAVEVVSNRADLISGGDALVAVDVPTGISPSAVRVRAGGRDVTGAFAMRADGRFEGLITGLPVGRVVVRATAARSANAREGAGEVTITNHPNGGPVFSGPQIQPWVCPSGARDKKCNRPATYSFLYKSTDAQRNDLQPYDPANPPDDVATTTTEQGQDVPFVVRQETGYQDRDQYKILTLFAPGQPWKPWAPQPQWNHKLLIPHGGGCGYAHASGSAPLHDFSGTFSDVTALQDSYVTALGRGFAVLSTALNNLGHNCNLLTQAESLMMAKERLVERYGTIRYTIGTGCSGGSIVQNQVANAYPGIYQGLITTCSYPDAVSTLAQFADLHMLRRYFEDPSTWGPGVAWLPTQMADVEGHGAHVNAVVSDEEFFKPLSNPSEPCDGVRDDQRYDPAARPGGVRCVMMDYLINVFGHRPRDVWGPEERRIGKGFGAAPVGNTGILYGLQALERGSITVDQFIDVNAKIGGLNIDGRPIARRGRADIGGLRNAYRSGVINDASNLTRVAIINHGGPDPGAAHDYGHAYWTRARLERAQGHTRNMVMWFGNAALVGDPRWANEALLAMDRWLTAVEADTSARPLPDKIVHDRPADLGDRCTNLPGFEMVDVPGAGPVCENPTLQTRFGSPRDVAGGPATNDANECQLKPLRRADFYPLAFTDAQWARLQAAFPGGVCDYGKAPLGQGATVEWQTYSDATGDVVYGGRPLAAAPPSSGTGWTSSAFASWRVRAR